MTVPGDPLNWVGLVPVAQILTHVRPAYAGNTWDEALTWLHETSAEADVIANLAGSIRATTPAPGLAPFTQPIRIDQAPPLDDDDEPDPLGRIYVLSNGMHRIATAVMLGYDTLLCTDDYDRDAYTEYVDIKYHLPGNWNSDSEDELDFSAGWLRSFPLPDGTWVENDSFSSCSGALSGLWVCPHTHTDALLNELHRRYPSIDIVSVTPTTSVILDAEWAAEFGNEDPYAPFA